MTDQQGVQMADYYAQKVSEDTSRKVGFIIHDGDHTILSTGVNNFPLGVEHTPERLQRPAKYLFTEHAERDAIYSAARHGRALGGSIGYSNWYPCADCARAIVSVGIVRLVCLEPNWNETQYGFDAARIILREGGVEVTFVGQKEEAAQ